MTWIVIPFVIAMVIFVWGASVYFDAIRAPPDDAMEVYVVGKQWMWKFQHPDGQREINELHVPVGRPVQADDDLPGRDPQLLHPGVPREAGRLPGRYTTMWFEATKPGTYHLFCAEYCGTKHSGMIGGSS